MKKLTLHPPNTTINVPPNLFPPNIIVLDSKNAWLWQQQQILITTDINDDDYDDDEEEAEEENLPAYSSPTVVLLFQDWLFLFASFPIESTMITKNCNLHYCMQCKVSRISFSPLQRFCNIVRFTYIHV